MPIRLIICLFVSLVSLPAFGQEPIPQSFLEELARDLAKLQQPAQALKSPSVRAVLNNAPVYAGASTDTQAIMRMSAGDEAQVIANAGDWYAIKLPNDKSGWVQTRNVAPVAETWTPSTITILEQLADMEVGETATSGWVEVQILSLLERAARFRDTYRNNQYVTVRGFDISLSITGPTLGMSFEFKE